VRAFRNRFRSEIISYIAVFLISVALLIEFFPGAFFAQLHNNISLMMNENAPKDYSLPEEMEEPEYYEEDRGVEEIKAMARPDFHQGNMSTMTSYSIGEWEESFKWNAKTRQWEEK